MIYIQRTGIIFLVLLFIGVAFSQTEVHADWLGDSDYEVDWTFDTTSVTFSSPTTEPIDYTIGDSELDSIANSFAPEEAGILTLDFTSSTEFELTAEGTGLLGPSVMTVLIRDLDWTPVAGEITSVKETSLLTSGWPVAAITSRTITYDNTGTGSDILLTFNFTSDGVLASGRSFTSVYEVETEHGMTPIPEPESYLLLGSMLLSVGLIASRKRTPDGNWCP
ncbi:hypothetical protein SCG7086_BH_00020 [Chlamydiales bacterium SCGC AG-110-P3]|nr:hypothetical protein SCG7086_BH_00020 [Chlamydiales bacterium SCGC AG-110-P3]